MGQKIVLVALLLLLLAGAALFAFTGDAAPDMPSTPAGDGTATTAANAAPANPLAHDAADASGSAANTERALGASLEEGSARPLPDRATWVTVKVVEKATGSPLAGAVVQWYDETAWEWLQEHDTEGASLDGLRWQGDRLATLAGWRTRSDALGEARITLKEQTTVVALHGGLYGTLGLNGNTIAPVGGYVVELVPELALTVRVRDDRGVPTANVPVTISVLDQDGDESAPYGRSALATTGPDGLATIPHLQQLRGQNGGWFPWGGGESRSKREWRARLALCGIVDKGVVFDIEAPPTTPIELQLPPYGSLRVRAELAGKPLPGFRSATISTEGGERHYVAAYRSARAGADGQVRFMFVPVGAEYDVHSDVIGGLGGKFPGPRAAGQEAEAVLTPERDAMLLAGRLLLPDRTPAAEQPMHVQADGPRLHTEADLRTDRDGRFLVNLGAPRKDNKIEQLRFDLRKKGEPPRQAAVEGRTLRPGIEELGDVVLSEGELLVAGRTVVGDQPYDGALNLRLEREGPGEGGKPRWRRAEGQLVHRDGAAFTIRGKRTPGRYRLAASSERSLPIAPLDVELGATDLVVRIDAGHGLALSLLLPDKASGENLTLALVPAAPTDDATLKERLRRDLEGPRGNRRDVRWPSLPAGVYSLEVRLFPVAQPLLVIPDIVLPRPAAGDPRLVDIDLRPQLRVVEFTLHDPDGKPLGDAGGVMFPTAQATPGEWLGYSFWSARPVVLLPSGPYDLLVCAGGYRPQPARGDAATLDVRLDRWPTLTVNVPAIPALPEKARVQVALQPTAAAEGRYRAKWGSGTLAEYLVAPQRTVPVRDGKAALPISDGLWTIKLSVNANRRSESLDGFTPKQVLSNAGEVTLTVPKEQWERAIEVVKQPPKPGEQPTGNMLQDFPFRR